MGTLAAGQKTTVTILPRQTLEVFGSAEIYIRSGMPQIVSSYAAIGPFDVNVDVHVVASSDIKYTVDGVSAEDLAKEENNSITELMKYRPVGFNYYSLMSEIIYGVGNLATIRPANLDYIRSTGANLVRVQFGVYDGPSLLTRVHNTAAMPDEVLDSNLRPSFISACNLAMDSLSQYGLYCHANILWGQNTVSGMFSETQSASVLPGSKTREYSISFCKWFVDRYKNHPALAYLSIGNEYVTDETATAAPTQVQLSEFFGALSQAAKEISPKILVTADISSPPINLTRTKPTIEQTIDKFRVLYSGLDFYCLHLYNELYSFTGHTAGEAVGVANNAVYSPLGYEGFESLMQAYADMAKADNKILIIGEFGINEDNESSDPGNTHYDTKKKRRLFKSVIPYATVSLVWNVQDTAQAATAGDQNIWCIDPAITTNNRKADILTIAKAYNYGKQTGSNVGGGNPSRKYGISPKFSIRIPNRTAGYNVRMTSTAAHSSSSGYSLAVWIKLGALLNNGETLMDLRGAGNLSGFIFLAILQANAKSFYMDGRYASGSAGNTLNTLPDFEIGDWNHIVINTVSRTINAVAVSYAEIWLNGIYWQTVNMTAGIATIPVGTTLYVMGNPANGAPVRMQDISVFPSALSNAEVWAHMAGEISQREIIHIRAQPDGVIQDVSKNAIALTITGAVMKEEA